MKNEALHSLGIPGRQMRQALFLTFLLLAAAVAPAQQGDQKLSTDPLQIVLPDDARIEAAEAIGTRTLAVWGSTRTASDGSIRNVLYMQMFEGSAPYGGMSVLTSEEADPSGYLQVVVLEGRFLVAWNDRRSGSLQGYFRRVAVGGSVGAEERIGSGAIAAPGMLVTEVESGSLLHWTDSSQTMTIRERQFDQSGRPIMTERSLDSGRVLGVKRPTNMWGTLLLERGDPPPLLRASDGTILRITGVAAEKFAMRYYLDEDGSVLSMKNGVLYHYRSLLDTLPERAVATPLTATGFPSILTPYAIPSRDSLGRLEISYPFPYQKFSGGEPWQYSGFSVFRITELSSGSFGTPQEIAYRRARWGFNPRYFAESILTGISIERRCDNRYTMIYQLRTDWAHRDNPVGGEYFDTLSVNVGRHGEIPPGHRLSSCGRISPAWIQRAFATSSSQVDLLAGGRIHRLSAPGAMLAVDVPERTPVIMVEQGRFLIAYHRLSLGPAMMLASWSTDGTFAIVDSSENSRGVNPPARTGGQKYSGPHPAVVSPARADGLKNNDSLLAGSNAFLLERWVSGPERTGPTTTIDSQVCTIYLPTAAGWRQALRKAIGREEPQNEYHTRIVARDPATDDFVLLVSMGGTATDWRLFVAGFNTAGAQRWSADPEQVGQYHSPTGMVPLSPSNYLLMTNNGSRAFMLRFERDSMVRSTEISYIAHSENVRFLPLSAGVLRWTWRWPSRQIGLELRDSNGAQLFISTAALPDSVYDPTIIANPNNNGFIILTASPNGVHAVSLDSTLTTIGPSRRISETTAPVFQPRGAIIGDRLNILWEDRRDGVSDIYGRSLELSRLW